MGDNDLYFLWNFMFPSNYYKFSRGCKMALFEIKNLTFTYPDAEKPAIENIHLSIEPGEFVVILRKVRLWKNNSDASF